MASTTAASLPPPRPRVIFRPWITLPNGERLYAKTLGKRAFPIPVDPEDEPKK